MTPAIMFKAFIGVLATYSVINVLLTIRELRKLERTASPYLASAGIANIDGGVRCFVGIYRLGFQEVGTGLSTSTRWIFRGYVLGVAWLGALVVVLAATGIDEL